MIKTTKNQIDVLILTVNVQNILMQVLTLQSSRRFTNFSVSQRIQLKKLLYPLRTFRIQFQAAIKRPRQANRYLPVIETFRLWQGEEAWRPLRQTASKPKEKSFHYCTLFSLRVFLIRRREEKKKKKPWIIHEGRGPASAVNSAGVSPLSVAEAFFSPSAGRRGGWIAAPPFL